MVRKFGEEMDKKQEEVCSQFSQFPKEVTACKIGFNAGVSFGIERFSETATQLLRKEIRNL